MGYLWNFISRRTRALHGGWSAWTLVVRMSISEKYNHWQNHCTKVAHLWATWRSWTTTNVKSYCCKYIVARTAITDINRQAFRILFPIVFIQILSVGRFVLGRNLHEEIFPQLSSIFIEEFCSCYTAPHRSLTCPRESQNTKPWSLMDPKPFKTVNYLRLISLETNLAYCTEDFVFSALYIDRTDN